MGIEDNIKIAAGLRRKGVMASEVEALEAALAEGKTVKEVADMFLCDEEVVEAFVAPAKPEETFIMPTKSEEYYDPEDKPRAKRK